MILAAPLLFAFAAGMAATVNPCGFAMLPAYVSMFLGGDTDTGTRLSVFAGLRVGLAVTVGFVALFSAVGVLVSAGLQSLLRFVPWVALVIGVGLFALGIAVLRGFHLSARMIDVRTRRTRSFSSMVGFGVAFGVASVSCTLPIFLAVVGLSVREPSLLGGWAVFGAYAVGMGVVLTAVAVALVTSRQVLLARMRRVLPYVERIGGWLLVGSGLFIVYYWTVALSVPPGVNTPWYAPIAAIDRISAWFTTRVGNAPLLWAGLLVLVILAVVAAELARARRRDTTTRPVS